MKIIMLGAPGAGKGTQAVNIAKEYDIPHVSTGDIFRANIKAGTKLGKEACAYMEKGQLVPDEITIGMLLNRIEEDDCKKGYVLDGFPRTIAQAESLKSSISGKNEKIDYAVNIDVPDEDIVGRMTGRRSCPKCGASYHITFNPPKNAGVCDHCGEALVQRDDDKPETVENRLRVYHEQTKPLIEYYEKEGILKSVDGTKAPAEVFAQITEVLK